MYEFRHLRVENTGVCALKKLEYNVDEFDELVRELIRVDHILSRIRHISQYAYVAGDDGVRTWNPTMCIPGIMDVCPEFELKSSGVTDDLGYILEKGETAPASPECRTYSLYIYAEMWFPCGDDLYNVDDARKIVKEEVDRIRKKFSAVMTEGLPPVKLTAVEAPNGFYLSAQSDNYDSVHEFRCFFIQEYVDPLRAFIEGDSKPVIPLLHTCTPRVVGPAAVRFEFNYIPCEYISSLIGDLERLRAVMPVWDRLRGVKSSDGLCEIDCELRADGFYSITFDMAEIAGVGFEGAFAWDSSMGDKWHGITGAWHGSMGHPTHSFFDNILGPFIDALGRSVPIELINLGKREPKLCSRAKSRDRDVIELFRLFLYLRYFQPWMAKYKRTIGG